MDDAMAVIRDLTYMDPSGEERPLLEVFAEMLQTTADEVTEFGTPGVVTLKIAVKPLKEGGRASQGIIPDLGRTPPKPKLGGVIRFNTNGRLSRTDQRQQRLPLRTVETGQVEARDIAVGQPVAREV